GRPEAPPPLGPRLGAARPADRRADKARFRRVRGCSLRAGRARVRAASGWRVARAMGEPFEHKLRVRYVECDPQGVVFNSHYLAYFDINITELWRTAFGGYRAM